MIKQNILNKNLYLLFLGMLGIISLFFLTPVQVNAQSVNSNCEYTVPEEPTYSFEHIYTQVPYAVDPGEIFITKVYIANKGNTTWFSDAGECVNQHYLRLGTARDRDRESVFAQPSIFNEVGWITKSRIILQEDKVEPGEVATFIFWSKAPEEEDVYREYFQPVIDGVSWVENTDFYIDFFVGDIDWTDELEEKLEFMSRTMRASEFDASGGRSIHIKLSTQTMQAKVGEEIVYEFPVSTGAASTPTPTGTFSVLYKQEVRATTYIMPNWMAFTSVGHGIHALPSLRYDNGYYWTEALNHIGIPVSHGCVRLLPDDAVTIYNFTPVGTPIHITW